MTGGRVGVGVLGPLAAEVGGRAVDLGGPLQRAVLALLLVERGQVVSVDRMIDQLWRGEAPPRAIASLQAYVSNLRRQLEPDRAQRSPGRVLVSAPPGYAVRLPAEAVDAWHFERLLGQAHAAADGDPATARRCLAAGLALWHGCAYAEFADEQWAVAEAARLDELHAAAWELWAQVTLRAGTAAEVVPAAQVMTRQNPLREEGWRLLAMALWGSGRQGDALAALRSARQVLGDELGIDPGPALAELEEAILHQRLEVLDRAQGGAGAARPALGAGAVARPQTGAVPGPGPEVPGQGAGAAGGEVFVGRGDELAALRAVAAAARSAGGVVLVTGEAGVGKSSLLRLARGQLTAAGWMVVAGGCPETDGVPAAWAWVQALRALAQVAPPEDAGGELGPLLGDSALAVPAAGSPAAETSADAAAGRFRLHRAVAAWLLAAAAAGPLAVFLDDLHNADTETLALTESVTAELGGSPVLVVGAYRPADAGDRLGQLLAVLARRSPLRLALGGLPLSDVGALVRAICGGPVDGQTLVALAERTGGNPFYVRESARLLASEGALVAVSEVPEGVRDVLRRRLARLPPPAVAVLRLAAVAGREAEVEVLADAADADENAVLDGLEAGVFSGLLTEPVPGRVRFTHELVRDTLYTDLTQLRRTRMHGRVADSLRRLRPDDLTAIAYHYLRSASASTAPAAVEYATRAADLASRRYAYDTEVSLLEQALAAFGRITEHAEDPAAREVSLLGRLLRAQIRAGQVRAARATRQRAVAVAERDDREDLVAEAFAAWTEPTPWLTRPYGFVDERAVAALSRLLDHADLAPPARCRLLAGLVQELAGEDDPRPGQAATEALRIARDLGDADLTALALAACARTADHAREPARREQLAAELAMLAQRQEMPAYQWYAEYVTGSAAAARGHVAALRRSLDRQLELARRYRMTEPEAVNLCTEAMLAHVEGRFADAERGYAAAATQMARSGSMHAAGFYPLALLTIRISQDRIGQIEQLIGGVYEQLGGVAADAWAAVLAAGGRLAEARAVRAGAPALRPDFFHSVFATIRAMTVVALAEHGEAERLLADLMPVRDQLAGAASTSLAMRPVAHTLGELCLLLGRREDAAGHFAHAGQVALRWRSPHWADQARAALAAL